MKKVSLSERVTVHEVFLAAAYMTAIGATKADEVFVERGDENTTNINSEFVKGLVKSFLPENVHREIGYIYYSSSVCEPAFDENESTFEIIDEVTQLIQHYIKNAASA